MTVPRREALTGFYGEELDKRFIVRNTGITIENFYERIRMIHDMKLSHREDFEYDTSLYDNRGNRIFKLEPTMYGLDSLALIMSETYADEDELSGSMAAASTAKSNSAVFKRIIPLLKAANIILCAINHITEDIQINQFQRKVRDYPEVMQLSIWLIISLGLMTLLSLNLLIHLVLMDLL